MFSYNTVRISDSVIQCCVATLDCPAVASIVQLNWNSHDHWPSTSTVYLFQAVNDFQTSLLLGIILVNIIFDFEIMCIVSPLHVYSLSFLLTDIHSGLLKNVCHSLWWSSRGTVTFPLNLAQGLRRAKLVAQQAVDSILNSKEPQDLISTRLLKEVRKLLKISRKNPNTIENNHDHILSSSIRSGPFSINSYCYWYIRGMWYVTIIGQLWISHYFNSYGASCFTVAGVVKCAVVLTLIYFSCIVVIMYSKTNYTIVYIYSSFIDEKPTVFKWNKTM